MRPKSQKRIKISTEPFEASEFYPISETSLAELCFKFRRAKRFRRKNTEPLRFTPKPLEFCIFLTEPFFALWNFKKRFCKRGFCYRVKFRSFKVFCRIFYPFLRLWTHLEAFTFLRNLFGRFGRPSFFSE